MKTEKSRWASVSVDQLFGQLHVIDASARVGIVEQSRQAVAWSFAQTNVSLDNGRKYHIAEMLFPFFVDLIGQTKALVLHRPQEAFDFQRRNEFGLDGVDRI